MHIFQNVVSLLRVLKLIVNLGITSFRGYREFPLQMITLVSLTAVSIAN